MYEASLLIEKLEQIQEALSRVQRRFVGIESVDDFLDSDEGLDKLDAICMMLLAVGESFKKIDAEEIFFICQNNLEPLQRVVKR